MIFGQPMNFLSRQNGIAATGEKMVELPLVAENRFYRWNFFWSFLKRQKKRICQRSLILPASRGWASDAYPTRPVRVIVPYAAGGGPDVLMRQVGPALGEALGQPIVVENKVGAAGVLAAQVVAASPPDGYTLLMGSNTHLTQKLMQPSLNQKRRALRKLAPTASFRFPPGAGNSPRA